MQPPLLESEPLFIDLEPSYGCNLRCRMCHVTYMKDTQPRFLDINRIDWHFVRNRDVSLGSIFEPMIHPSFNELIGSLNNENARISFVTNAFNLSLDRLSNLNQSRLNIVTFSFDGASQEKYEYIRQGGKYSKTLERIKKFINQFQNSDAIFVVNFTVCQYNMDEIIPAIDLWESLGVHTLSLIGMVSREKQEFFTQNSLLDVRGQYEDYLEKAANYLTKRNFKISLKSPYFSRPEIQEKYSSYFLEPDVITGNKNHISYTSPLHHRYGYGNSIIPHQSCQSPLTSARVDYDANVYICQVIKIGNLYERSFREIWNSQERNQIISQLIDNPRQCDSCDYFRFCINSQYVDYEQSDNFFSQNILNNNVPQIRLIEEDYQGYNILEVGGKFYGIPQAEGEFNLERIEKQDYSVTFSAEDEATLRHLVNENPHNKIQLIEEGYQGYNILEVGGRFYGIPQAEGEFNLERIEKRDYSITLSAEDEATLRHLVNENPYNKIQLIEEGYQGYNILEVGGKFYGIPQAEGEFSLERIEKQDYSVTFSAEDESTLHHQIAEYNQNLRSPPPSEIFKTAFKKRVKQILSLFR